MTRCRGIPRSGVFVSTDVMYLSIMTDQEVSDQITRAAQELIDRHGNNAIEFAKERVEILKNSDGGVDLDFALLVLSEVERLRTS